MRAEKPAVHLDPALPTKLDGERWVMSLGAALLIIFTAAVGLRWLEPLLQRGGSEAVLQQPVPESPTGPRQEPTAPDPGDNP